MSYQNHTRKLFIQHKGRCFYCNRKVFCPRFANHKNVELIKLHDIYILCRINGEYRVFPVGTLDHLIQRSKGGEDTPGNLVLACATCNKRREQQNTKKSPTLEDVLRMNEEGRICDCGNFLKKAGRKCSSCSKLHNGKRKICLGCGQTARDKKKYCRRCQKLVKPNEVVMYYI